MFLNYLLDDRRIRIQIRTSDLSGFGRPKNIRILRIRIRNTGKNLTMQNNDLRKKCKEEGLNTWGERRALIARHQKLTLLYNSECDMDKPR
jgi:hypothetical protein